MRRESFGHGGKGEDRPKVLKVRTGPLTPPGASMFLATARKWYLVPGVRPSIWAETGWGPVTVRATPVPLAVACWERVSVFALVSIAVIVVDAGIPVPVIRAPTPNAPALTTTFLTVLDPSVKFPLPVDLAGISSSGGSCTGAASVFAALLEAVLRRVAIRLISASRVPIGRIQRSRPHDRRGAARPRGTESSKRARSSVRRSSLGLIIVLPLLEVEAHRWVGWGVEAPDTGPGPPSVAGSYGVTGAVTAQLPDPDDSSPASPSKRNCTMAPAEVVLLRESRNSVGSPGLRYPEGRVVIRSSDY